MLIISVILSIGLIAGAFLAYRREGSPIALALILAAGGAFIGFALPPLLLHGGLIILGLLVWKPCKWSAKTFLGYASLAAIGSYGFFIYAAVENAVELRRLRNEYAFDSMETRVPAPKKQLAVEQSPEARTYLKELEQAINDDSNGFRALMLQRLHEDSVRSFVDSPGFGVGRRIRPTEITLKVNLERDGTPVLQPNRLPTSTLSKDELREPTNGAFEPLRRLHLKSVIEFVNPRGFGLVASRTKVAGFQSHQFGVLPLGEEWKVASLELVGVLMHDEAVVYVSDELPRMEQIGKVPVRSLNVFESAGLDQIMRGDSLFIRETPRGMLMLGAIRSAEQCAKCHGGERGDLLGAFSYSLIRLR